MMDSEGNSNKSEMNWTIKNFTDSIPRELQHIIANETTEVDEFLEPTVYSSYSSELLLAGAVSCTLLSICGITGNLISILALAMKKKLHNPTTAFIVNLCVADMLYCGFTIPMTALTFLERRWNYSVPLCKIYAVVKIANGVVSIFTVVAITVNRYIRIVHPNIYAAVYSKINMAVYIFCLWMFPLTLISLPLFDIWGTLKYDTRVAACGIMERNGKSPRVLIFIMVMIVPSVLFVTCYSRIYFVVKKAVRRSHRKSGCEELDLRIAKEKKLSKEKDGSKFWSVYAYLSDKKEFRVLRIILVIFLVYMITIIPFVLMKLFRKEGEFHVLNILVYMLFFASSVINPVLYIIMSREYRSAYIELFHCKSS